MQQKWCDIFQLICKKGFIELQTIFVANQTLTSLKTLHKNCRSNLCNSTSINTVIAKSVINITDKYNESEIFPAKIKLHDAANRMQREAIISGPKTAIMTQFTQHSNLQFMQK